mmetsp:Transcript_51726/g.129830  ORF Transcript_51726/g.129830 Transcript_51726/m.129830 type:complete len:101 (-) Transcript_51726:1980-2282(-)
MSRRRRITPTLLLRRQCDHLPLAATPVRLHWFSVSAVWMRPVAASECLAHVVVAVLRALGVVVASVALVLALVLVLAVEEWYPCVALVLVRRRCNNEVGE